MKIEIGIYKKDQGRFVALMVIVTADLFLMCPGSSMPRR